MKNPMWERGQKDVCLEYLGHIRRIYPNIKKNQHMCNILLVTNEIQNKNQSDWKQNQIPVICEEYVGKREHKIL